MSEIEKITNEDEEEYTPELIDLEDEEGNTVTFEIIDGMEIDGVGYFALIPYSEDEDEDIDDDEFVILRETEKDGEKYLATIDNDDEYDRVGAAFLQRFSELIEADDEEEE